MGVLSTETLYQDDPEGRRYAAGKGVWRAICADELRAAQALAEGPWAKALEGVDYPWLCWNVADEWCLVQQRMVRSVGWTPVVGFDPRVGEPPLVEGAILVDFNAGLDFPMLHMAFPMELVYLFAPRLAFWHSDLLVREPLFRELAQRFRQLPDGATAAVDVRNRWFRRIPSGKRGRFWELIGCTTRGASADQFANGCGWWKWIDDHPNGPDDERERVARRAYSWDHGGGILAWNERCGGKVKPIRAKSLHEGHCTRIGNKLYEPQGPMDVRRDLSRNLLHNYDLLEVCGRLGLTRFLRD
ncbi:MULTISPECIES: hypothetical protein [unclassified Thioalkalivibrio]|uniref:hypothetical protein n=1 Tax=unclassified Thioalkalivibrio TaxID=2621013 RepID=UPI001E4F7DFF|nr:MULTISPECIES: hypothetical protein [unclassified Thioalkalivibrio]